MSGKCQARDGVKADGEGNVVAGDETTAVGQEEEEGGGGGLKDVGFIIERL